MMMTKERGKTHPLLLPNIEDGTKVGELNKNLDGYSMKSYKTALAETKAVDGSVLNKDA